MLQRHFSLIDHTTAFAGYLRSHGFLVGLEEVKTALEALTKMDLGSKSTFLSVLRVAFTTSPDEWSCLDEKYSDFIQEYRMGVESKIKTEEVAGKPSSSRSPASSSYQINRIKDWLNKSGLDSISTAFYSSDGNDGFREAFPLENDSTLASLVRSFVNVLAYKKRYRRVTHSTKGVVNLRKLIQNRFTSGDELLNINYLHRPISKSRLIFLCDVSRSMEVYANFIQHLVYYIRQVPVPSKIYFFNTRLHPLPSAISKSWTSIKSELEQIPGLWSSGTKIGQSFHDFLHQAPGWFGRQTKLIIYSDGWDTGDLDLLAESIFEMQKRSRQIIWLNPVLKNEEALKVSGLREAVPYVDVLAPLYNHETLADLVIDLRKKR